MPRLEPVRPVPHERRVYYVQSSDDKRLPYWVDLEAYDGNGSCTCYDFEFGGKARKLEVGGRPKDDRLRCKHIRVAVEYETEKLKLKNEAEELHEHDSNQSHDCKD